MHFKNGETLPVTPVDYSTYHIKHVSQKNVLTAVISCFYFFYQKICFSRPKSI